MKKVLLTGATGLIGKYAIKPLLDAGFEVFALSGKTQEEIKGVNWIKANLFDFTEIKNVVKQIKPQYLLHFAWITGSGYLSSEQNYELRDASLNLLKEFQHFGGKRAVFAGTCFEYEFKNEPLKEDGKLNPTSIYAKCKNELNKNATVFSEQNNVSFGWGRIFYVYGEGENEKRLVPFVINSLKNDKEITITAGELIKDYLFAGDVAGAFVKFLDSDVIGSVNICSARPIKIKEIVSLIAKKLKKEHLVTFEDKPSSEPERIVGDNSRLINEVGYCPKFSFDFVLDNYLLK